LRLLQMDYAIDPDDSETLMDLVVVYARRGSTPQARACFDRLLTVAPQTLVEQQRAFAWRTELAIQEGQFREAVSIAAEGLARSPPDGYTVGLITTSTQVIAAIFNAGLSYDPVKDFAPISMIGSSPYVLAVNPGFAAKNVAELVALAKSKPGQVNNAAFGSTSLGHLAGVLFAHLAGIELNQVAYRSSAQAVIDAVAGRIEMQFSTLPPAVPLIREGKLRALATTGVKRVSLLPDVSTIAESGFPGYDVALWFGIAAPAGTPPGIVARFNREMSAVLVSPEVKDALAQQGLQPEPGPPEELGRRIDADLTKWRDLIAKVGIKAQ